MIAKKSDLSSKGPFSESETLVLNQFHLAVISLSDEAPLLETLNYFAVSHGSYQQLNFLHDFYFQLQKWSLHASLRWRAFAQNVRTSLLFRQFLDLFGSWNFVQHCLQNSPFLYYMLGLKASICCCICSLPSPWRHMDILFSGEASQVRMSGKLWLVFWLSCFHFSSFRITNWLRWKTRSHVTSWRSATSQHAWEISKKSWNSWTWRFGKRMTRREKYRTKSWRRTPSLRESNVKLTSTIRRLNNLKIRME